MVKDELYRLSTRTGSLSRDEFKAVARASTEAVCADVAHRAGSDAAGLVRREVRRAVEALLRVPSPSRTAA